MHREHWNNEYQLERLLRQEHPPHILLLAGMRDERVPAWHTEGLWERLRAWVPDGGRISNAVHLLHRFADGAHTCHTQPEYHQRIKKFIDRIFPGETTDHDHDDNDSGNDNDGRNGRKI